MLQENLTRKYAHCRKLQARVSELESALVKIQHVMCFESQSGLINKDNKQHDSKLTERWLGETREESVDPGTIQWYPERPNSKYVSGSGYDYVSKDWVSVVVSKPPEEKHPLFDSQSGEGTPMAAEQQDPGLSVMQGTDSRKEEIVSFADEDPGWTTAIEASYDETMDLAHATDSSLGNFLARPILAKRFQWNVNGFLFEQFNPWFEFQNNLRVAEKIKNYELLRYKLHMKVVVSGTQFHYGRAIVSYNPYSGFDEVTAERAFLDIDVIAASQKPHIWINPADNSAGDMCMPFFWRDNYLSKSKGDVASMGEVTFKSLLDLRHANGGNDPVTISVFLWAEDVVLTMPSQWDDAPVVFESQSGKGKSKSSNTKAKKNPKPNQINASDEYGQGIISKPAAVIAKAAGVLEAIPLISPYARATEMVASKIGQVAKIFGYSRPNVITEIQQIKPSPTGNLANTDASDAALKLTLDSKQELTIDSRTVGLDGSDQMTLAFLAQKESYLTTFNWTTANDADTLLWNSYVTPNLYGILSNEIHPTPMCMLAQAFEYWQGSIKFRFQVVKSKFHKGRMLVRFDPRIHNAIPEYNTAYSRVVDIAEEEDFEIVVGWAQARAFLECGQADDSVVNYTSSGRLGPDTLDRRNGILEIDVLNRLVSPSADTNVFVNVFVSMCDDFKFAFPTTLKIKDLHVFPNTPPTPPPVGQNDLPEEEEALLVPNKVFISQSGVMNEPETDKPMGTSALDPISEEADAADHQMEVFFGDTVVSLRDLFKRYTKHRTYVLAAPQTQNKYRFCELYTKVLPYFSGYDTTGVNTSTVNTGTKLSAVYTPFLTHFMPCYAGWRGGIRKKYVFHRNTPALLQPFVSPYFAGNETLLTIDSDYTNPGDYLSKQLSRVYNRSSGYGFATTNLGVNDTIEVEFPYYQPRRLSGARLVKATSLEGNRAAIGLTAYSIGTGSNQILDTTAFEEYVATGEDFSLFFFTGCPILYKYVVTEDQ